MSHMNLELGGPRRAANSIAKALPELHDCLESLLHELEGSFSGYQGAGADALSEVFVRWFDLAQEIPRTLGDYQSRLVMVDITSANADRLGADRLARSSAGGANASGLNLS